MRKLVKTIGFVVFLVFISGCSSMSIEPITPGSYFAPCTPDPAPVFQFSARRNQGVGNIFDVHAQLLINGEYITMDNPTSGRAFGNYRYVGDIPYDGEARYRFVVSYKVGYGIFSTNARARVPFDRYYLRPVGEVSWSADSIHESSPLPDTFIDAANRVDERPRRSLRLGEFLIPGITGPQSDTATLAIQNNYTYNLIIQEPRITDRASGGAVPELTIVQSSGSTTYPITLAGGTSVNFDVTYHVNMDGTNSVIRLAGIEIPYTDNIRNCSLGPIWIDAEYRYNPE